MRRTTSALKRDLGTPARGIVLIGFMGAGKTTVGRRLAQRLGWEFEDLDQRIEKLEDRKIHEIFEQSGEAKFRQFEHAALRKLITETTQGSARVIALGGGAFVQPRNAALVESAKIVTVFLDAGVDELWERCRNQANKESLTRPLLQSFEKFHELHAARRPFYLKASVHVETTAKSVDQIAEELAEVLNSTPTHFPLPKIQKKDGSKRSVSKKRA